MNKASRIATAFFLLGLALIGIGFTKINDAIAWFQTGGLAWVIAYFLIVVDNLMRKAPVQTRGGLVRYEDGRFKYLFPYVFMFVFGILFLMAIIISFITS